MSGSSGYSFEQGSTQRDSARLDDIWEPVAERLSAERDPGDRQPVDTLNRVIAERDRLRDELAESLIAKVPTAAASVPVAEDLPIAADAPSVKLTPEATAE